MITLSATRTQHAAKECDDFQIAVFMYWVKYKKQKIAEYQQ
jgi:hypothetical protein